MYWLYDLLYLGSGKFRYVFDLYKPAEQNDINWLKKKSTYLIPGTLEKELKQERAHEALQAYVSGFSSMVLLLVYFPITLESLNG